MSFLGSDPSKRIAVLSTVGVKLLLLMMIGNSNDSKPRRGNVRNTEFFDSIIDFVFSSISIAPVTSNVLSLVVIAINL